MEEEDEAGMGSLENLLKWGKDVGISDSFTGSTNPDSETPSNPSCLGHTLSVSDFPRAGGRGLGTVRDLRKGELVLKVPKAALLTSDRVMRTDCHVSVAVANHPLLSSTQILTVCLLYEVGKGKKSWWYPYLKNLPRSYTTLSAFRQFEMQAFQVEDAIWAVKKARRKTEAEWKEARALMDELYLKPHLLTFRCWLWASATISSRTLHVPWDEAGCLCPVGDLFNYAAPGDDLVEADNMTPAMSTRVGPLFSEKAGYDFNPEQLDTASQRLTDGGFEEDVEAYCFYARKYYKKGEQVLLSYGTYTNLELLEHYGFLLDNNPNDKVYIAVEEGVSSCSSWPAESLYIHQSGKPSYELLCALRLWVTPSNQRRSVGHLAYSGSQLSSENEMCVMRLLLKDCAATLRQLNTTIEDDHHLLCSLDRIAGTHFSAGALDELWNLSAEARNFLESHGLQCGACFAESMSWKITRALERWKLAVQWRLRYKRTVVNCIPYCAEVTS